MNMNIMYISYGVPCLLIYLLTLFGIFAIRKRLNPSFVAIYMWTAVINLLTYSNAWVSLRLIDEKWFNLYYNFANSTGLLPAIHFFFVNCFFFSQNINSFLLTLDRFFAIVALNQFGMWKRYFPLFGLFLYASTSAILFVVGRYFDPDYVYTWSFNSSSDAFKLSLKNNSRVSHIVGQQVIFGILILVACISLSGISWTRLRSIKAYNKADRSLFFISFCIFVAQSMNILIIIAYYYFFYISYNVDIVLFIRYSMLYNSDVFSLGPGIYTLLIPGPIRRRCISTLTCGYISSKRIKNNESIQMTTMNTI